MENDQLVIEIAACERKVWQALVAGDPTADLALLDDGFLGVYSDGFAGKTGHAAQLDAGPTIQSYEMTDLRILSLGPDHALLSYHADFVRNRGTAPEAMYVSSVWRRRGAGWVNVFSQDTPVAEKARGQAG